MRRPSAMISVLVPVALLDVLFSGLGPQQSAAFFLVQLAPPVGADIRLVAFHSMFHRHAAELNTAVACVFYQHDFKAQFKVRRSHLANQELVLLETGRLADDLSIDD